jgi:hypothetical protein
MSISWENAVETQKCSADPATNNNIKAVVTGLPKSISNLFLEFLTDHDKNLVADFLDACLKQENISLNTEYQVKTVIHHDRLSREGISIMRLIIVLSRTGNDGMPTEKLLKTLEPIHHGQDTTD